MSDDAAIRLYEQEPGEALASSRLGLYVRRWVRWAGAGLGFTPGRHISGFGPPPCSRSPGTHAQSGSPPGISIERPDHIARADA